MAPNGCAVGPDGELLDPSQIIWYNDADNDEPMAQATTPLTAQPQPQLSATTLDSFVTKVPPPVRRSTRAACPSAKAIDPDNAMAIKRKSSNAPSPNPSCRLRQASPEHDEDKDSEPDASEPDFPNTEEDDPVGLGDTYQVTKALGDADRQVCM